MTHHSWPGSLARMRKKSGELICVMANQVAEARHRLTVQEQRMVLWLIAQIEPKDKDFLTHTLAVREFEKFTGTANGRLYEQTKSVATGLLRAVLEIREPGERSGVRFQWFSEVKYHDGQGTLTVRFHEQLRPFLLELKSRFTQLQLSQALKLRGGYSIRFYELIKARQGLKRFEMTVDELRHWAGLEDGEMPRMVDLRRFVIDAAKRELDAKADLTFQVEQLRTGRAVAGFAFRVRKNTPAKRARKPATAPEAVQVDETTRRAGKAALAQIRASLGAQVSRKPRKSKVS